MRASRRAVAGKTARRAAVVAFALACAFVVGLAGLPGIVTGKEKEKGGGAQTVTPQELDALGRQYRDAGLPLPPPDAPPTLLQVGPNGRGGVLWTVGFRVGPGETNPEPGRFLVGTETGEPYLADSSQPVVRPFDPAKGLPPSGQLFGGWKYSPDAFPVNHWLALAIQCHLRGDDRLAKLIFERGLARDEAAARRLTPLGDGGLRDSLAATAWNHWMNVLLLPDTDRREILARLEKLSAAFPALDGAFQRDYVASLRLTLVPSTAAPDSAEALIDGLIEHNGVDNPDDARLVMLGFAAMPALIAHIKDRRLTRSCQNWRQGDGVGEPEHVGEVVAQMIANISGGAAGAVSSSEDYTADRVAVVRWWARASVIGEETYMTKEVFPPTQVSLEIVSVRYPQRLEEIYARLLREQPGTSAEMIVQAIGACAQLAPAERIRLLRAGMASPDVERCYEALGVLLAVDQEAGEAAWIEKLDHWPVEAKGSYGSSPPEAGISELMTSTDSAEVWRAYERALFRARPELRMEMLARLAGVHADPPQDVRQLATLDLFLDDPEVRVIRKEDEAAGGRFEGYKVTSENRRLSVGNFVTELLAKMLNVKPPPGPARTEHWWAKYRESVRAAVEEHEREALQTPMEEE